jgi:hypothetical protein
MSIASGYEQASRREQMAYDREVAAREAKQRAVSAANALFEDCGGACSYAEIEQMSAMYECDADEAWSVYLAITDRES